MPDRSLLHLTIRGWGAVSPAGWDARSLLETTAAEQHAPLPVDETSRDPRAPTCRTRALPPPPEGVVRPRHPRLRRSSPLARHAMASAGQAISDENLAAIKNGEWSLGIVFCVMNGCVQFSRRFYQEVLENPATASPIVFPETVFNSPSSHLATALGSSAPNHTIIGDATAFFTGLNLAREWLEDRLVDAVLVVSSEELDWLSAEALQLFDSQGVAAEGAGAILLDQSPPTTDQPTLTCLPEPISYGSRWDRTRAAAAIARTLRHHLERFPGRGELPPVLIDSRRGQSRLDSAEQNAWSDWTHPRWSPVVRLGDGFAANGAWQCVTACAGIAAGMTDTAIISATGGTMQASGAIIRAGTG